MLTYALGRGLERYDKRTVKEIANRISTNDYRFSSLVLEIVNSLPFQMRRGEQEQHMMITGKHLHRRTFLQGMGAAIALPMLDAMRPAMASAATTAALKTPTRMAFAYVPNGVTLKDWKPAAVGADFEFYAES